MTHVGSQRHSEKKTLYIIPPGKKNYTPYLTGLEGHPVFI